MLQSIHDLLGTQRRAPKPPPVRVLQSAEGVWVCLGATQVLVAPAGSIACVQTQPELLLTEGDAA